MSKRHIVGNIMHWLKFFLLTFGGYVPDWLAINAGNLYDEGLAVGRVIRATKE